MKKVFRILIPILLVIAVIGSLIWYFFVYDREFTRDLLLSQARSMEETGNRKTAAWLYDLAYRQSSNDGDVAIELAQQYKNDGNYTKAEYTLSSAIADGGNSDLYIALCKTYVEQDKLLDAVNMLNSISDPAIKAELDALRPAVPSVDQKPDFYNQYISVTLSSETGTLYATTDGRYPTTATGPCTAPIQLSGGETTIYAVAVADNGLVSQLGIFGYTVGGVIEEVTFTDAAMEAAVRSQLALEEGTVIYSDTLWTVEEFVIPSEAESYTDLSWLPYLKTLSVDSAKSGQLTCLSGLSKLETLTVTNSHPSEEELSVIAALPELQRLTMQSCSLSTIAFLAPAVKLQYLDLSGNAIRDISVLSEMAGLQELYMANNALLELNALGSLSSLKKLDISYNSVLSIQSVCLIAGLQELNVSNNDLTSLSNIGSLTALTHLNASNNSITDVSGLAACTALQELDISNNAVVDIASLSALDSMTYFSFAHNQVTALPEFTKNSQLVTIDGSYNQITSVKQLGVLEHLNSVYLDYNPELESLTPLKNCHVLILVNVYGTKVSEVSFLTSQSIIVNFNPTL